ncbi:DNA repair protein RecO [Brevirhabdus pacifica]|uniref:DNA repair protein RecO n=1 Tax=Brevirhabdus pacifica TaxID=1267768 RepID=A0A1U7DJD0_9RHOB|nr:DNA repair protein RecO [Brevirhabdus pacifica]APX90096.1 DNA repair protein RecO [Brevirhabdus pacifica]OWU75314.1 DNA recombination protein RecO [Loktanella sp. 22II-4b]PJJ82650.1 DNA replication and repair protein RecO [Brevirhabdus pacifica]
MDWRDRGTLLSLRKHGESSVIIQVFTEGHGLHAGVVRGGTGRRLTTILQPGAQLEVVWRARLDQHIGAYTVEPLQSRAGLLSDRLALSGLNAVCALLAFCLPERAPMPGLYTLTQALLAAMEDSDDWPLDYLHWEMALLEQMGFGLDLTRCTVSGRTEGLTYVSPRTGKAVHAEAAGEWIDRMLPLSPALVRSEGVGLSDLLAGLATTGHFLANRLAPELGDRPLPKARQRLVDLLARE